MTKERAEDKLQEYIERMRAPNSNISFAAVVVDDQDSNNFLLEYGTNGNNYHIEYDITPIQKDNFNKNGVLILQTHRGGADDLKLIDTTSSAGNLLSKQYVPNLERIRPLKAGIGISDAKSIEKTGTLGAFFKAEHKGSTRTYFISNMHVMASYPEPMHASHRPLLKQEDIEQPSSKSASSLKLPHTNDKIGTTVWKCFGNEVDAAVALCNLGDSEINPGLYNYHKGIKDCYVTKDEYTVGNSAWKVGHATGYSYGIIKSKNAAVRMKNHFHSVNGLGEYIVFTNQIMTEDMAHNGDSGSLLNYYDGSPIGLTFADINFKQAVGEKVLENGDRVPVLGRSFHNKLEVIMKLLVEGKNYNEQNYPLNFKHFLI